MKENKTISNVKRIHIVWCMIFALFVASVYLTIQTATSGAELSHLETRRQELSFENQRLSSKLIKMSSLTEIEKQAEEKGYVNETETVYLVGSDSFAALQ